MNIAAMLFILVPAFSQAQTNRSSLYDVNLRPYPAAIHSVNSIEALRMKLHFRSSEDLDLLQAMELSELREVALKKLKIKDALRSQGLSAEEKDQLPPLIDIDFFLDGTLLLRDWLNAGLDKRLQIQWLLRKHEYIERRLRLSSEFLQSLETELADNLKSHFQSHLLESLKIYPSLLTTLQHLQNSIIDQARAAISLHVSTGSKEILRGLPVLVEDYLASFFVPSVLQKFYLSLGPMKFVEEISPELLLSYFKVHKSFYYPDLAGNSGAPLRILSREKMVLNLEVLKQNLYGERPLSSREQLLLMASSPLLYYNSGRKIPMNLILSKQTDQLGAYRKVFHEIISVRKIMASWGADTDKRLLNNLMVNWLEGANLFDNKTVKEQKKFFIRAIKQMTPTFFNHKNISESSAYNAPFRREINRWLKTGKGKSLDIHHLRKLSLHCYLRFRALVAL